MLKLENSLYLVHQLVFLKSPCQWILFFCCCCFFPFLQHLLHSFPIIDNYRPRPYNQWGEWLQVGRTWENKGPCVPISGLEEEKGKWGIERWIHWSRPEWKLALAPREKCRSSTSQPLLQTTSHSHFPCYQSWLLPVKEEIVSQTINTIKKTRVEY